MSAALEAGPAADSGIRNPYNKDVHWEILLLEPVNDWFLALCKDDPATADKVEEALDELADYGPQLGRPLVDRIHSSKIHNLKELRPHATRLTGMKPMRRKNEGCPLGGHQASGP